MFGKSKAAPCLEGAEIEDVSRDLKQAVKAEDVRLGAQAVYFFQDGRRVYLPYSCICSADAMVMHEHHACCSGHSVMNVPKVLVKYDGGQIFLSFTDEEVSKKVENFINEKVSAVISEK